MADVYASSARTKQLIRTEFAKLLHQHRIISKISVTDLVKNAGVSRSTFYTYYGSVADVAEDIKSETLHVFFDHIQIRDKNESMMFFDKIYCYMKKNESLFRLLLASREATDFVGEFGAMCRERFCALLESDPTLRDRHLLKLEVSTLTDGLVMQFIHYFSGEPVGTLEEIIALAKMWFQDLLRRRC